MGKRKARPEGFWLHYCGECGKKRHRTRGDAKDVIHAMERDPDAADHTRAAMRLQAYHCPHGPGWHVGHSYKLIKA